MDAKKTGALIAQLRRERDMTQRELAQALGVTDKAVSRWETGLGFPDVSLLQPLAGTLGVTVTDLINGERTPPEAAAAGADRAVLDTLAYARRRSRTLVGILLLALGFALALSPLFLASMGPVTGLWVLGGVVGLAAGAAVTFTGRGRPARTGRPREDLARGLALGLTLAALALELTPWGAVLVFAPGPRERVRQTFSYFSLLPLGYGNPFPLCAGVLTLAGAAVELILLVRRGKGRLHRAGFLLPVLAALCSGLSVIYGVESLSGTGVGISVLLLLAALLEAYAHRNKTED